jgi:hypothetical protein
MAFTIEVFRNMLRVNKHRLDDELEIQAETQERISSHLARLNSRQLELKKSLDATEALVISRLKDNDAKMSNPVAEKEARRDREYVAAWQAWSVARQEHEEWLGLYEAWKSRGYQLKTLADLHGDSYFTIDSTSSRSSLREDPEAARTRMREAAARLREPAPAPAPETPPPSTIPRRRALT